MSINIKSKTSKKVYLKNIKESETFLHEDELFMKTRDITLAISPSVTFNCISLKTGLLTCIQSEYPGAPVLLVDLEAELIYK